MSAGTTYVTDNHTHYACVLCTQACVSGRACKFCRRRVFLLGRNTPTVATIERAAVSGNTVASHTCNNGCGFLGSGMHTCPRLTQSLPVVANGGVFRDFDAYTAQFVGDRDVHVMRERGVVVRVLREHSSGIPTSIRVLHAQRRVEMVVVTSTAVAEPNIVQHALLHAETADNDTVPLWPHHQPQSTFGATVVSVVVRACTLGSAHVMRVYRSPCARARWAPIFGARYAANRRRTPPHAKFCAVPYINGSACLPAAYVAHAKHTTCALCARSYVTHTAFVSACAPDTIEEHRVAPHTQ